MVGVIVQNVRREVNENETRTQGPRRNCGVDLKDAASEENNRQNNIRKNVDLCINLLIKYENRYTK